MRTPSLRISSMRTAGVALAAAAGLVATALATTTSADAAGTTKIEVQQRVCRTATAGHSTCMAMKREWKTVSSAKAKQLEAKGAAVPASKAHLGYGPAGGYSPQQVARAYGIRPGARTKQKVAIVDAFDDPSVRKDLNAFDRHYGIHRETRKSLKVVNQRGKTSPLPVADEGWAGEISLDVQSVRAVCRHCKILLVEADSNKNADLAAAVSRAEKLGAKVISNSYGGPENRRHLKPYNRKGVAILASSGDSGWYDWTGFNGGFPASDKASTPAAARGVIGVGGTSLFLNRNSSRASESVWNSNGTADVAGQGIVALTGGGYLPGAAGSGCSTIFRANGWQKHAQGFRSLGCGAKASEVDVAALADPFTGFDVYETFNWCTSPDPNVCPYTSADNGWATYGGTSLSSPLVAGMWALAGGPGKHKRPEAVLYANWKKSRSVTHDVTEGGTGGCYLYAPRGCASYPWFAPNPNTLGAGRIDCAWDGQGRLERHVGQCYAQTGFDGVSGLGTPHGLKLFRK